MRLHHSIQPDDTLKGVLVLADRFDMAGREKLWLHDKQIFNIRAPLKIHILKSPLS